MAHAPGAIAVALWSLRTPNSGYLTSASCLTDSLHFRRDVQACAMWADALSAFTLVHPGTQTCAPCGHLRRHAGAVT